MAARASRSAKAGRGYSCIAEQRMIETIHTRQSLNALPQAWRPRRNRNARRQGPLHFRPHRTGSREGVTQFPSTRPRHWMGLGAAALACMDAAVAWVMRQSATFVFWSALFAFLFGVLALVCWAASNNVDRFLQQPAVRTFYVIALLGTIAAGGFHCVVENPGATHNHRRARHVLQQERGRRPRLSPRCSAASRSRRRQTRSPPTAPRNGAISTVALSRICEAG